MFIFSQWRPLGQINWTDVGNFRANLCFDWEISRKWSSLLHKFICEFKKYFPAFVFTINSQFFINCLLYFMFNQNNIIFTYIKTILFSLVNEQDFANTSIDCTQKEEFVTPFVSCIFPNSHVAWKSTYLVLF